MKKFFGSARAEDLFSPPRSKKVYFSPVKSGEKKQTEKISPLRVPGFSTSTQPAEKTAGDSLSRAATQWNKKSPLYIQWEKISELLFTAEISAANTKFILSAYYDADKYWNITFSQGKRNIGNSRDKNLYRAIQIFTGTKKCRGRRVFFHAPSSQWVDLATCTRSIRHFGLPGAEPYAPGKPNVLARPASGYFLGEKPPKKKKNNSKPLTGLELKKAREKTRVAKPDWEFVPDWDHWGG